MLSLPQGKEVSKVAEPCIEVMNMLLSLFSVVTALANGRLREGGKLASWQGGKVAKSTRSQSCLQASWPQQARWQGGKVEKTLHSQGPVSLYNQSMTLD
jgi:hypothetical protein